MNRLQYETSPYLLQHADNPVNWYPWGDEALTRAKAEDKPILLSIGYSACHWCHVMAHESFEDAETAAQMNAGFINVKVDREERPDIDDLYMKATQIFNQGHGGWPMTVFLTPDGRPFHAGTYYPPQPRHGMPSFRQIMAAVLDAYRNRRNDLENAADEVTQMLHSGAVGKLPNGDSAFTVELLSGAAQALIRQADLTHGGLHTGRPKFPNPMNLDYLLRYVAHTNDQEALGVVRLTLEKMARGGIYDQLGGGFHRYSVDEFWLVPHFEKMLYDNAQLARVYLHAYQVTGEAFFRQICQDILTYLEREMRDPSGGFYSTQDADSEGVEGKFFVWTPEEVWEVLADWPEESVNQLLRYWDISAGGNFEGANIPHVDEPHLPAPDIEQARQRLFASREKRIKPGRDEKMLAAWNGLALAVFAEAGRVLDEARYLEIARQNADFILSALTMPDGRLYRSHKAGQSKLNGYLEDYANVIDGLLELYQAVFEPRYFAEAERLAAHVLSHFKSEDGGGFYDTSDDHETLVARPRTLQDNATPSGNNVMAFNFLRLSAYTGKREYEDATLEVFRQTLAAVQSYPSAFGMGLAALDLLVRRPVEVAIIGQDADALLGAIRKPFYPRVVVAYSAEDCDDAQAVPLLLANRTQRNQAATVYVCQNFACAAPVNTAQEVTALLKT